jgi:acetyltransferase-like isoleucine patch superfamily enzyme
MPAADAHEDEDRLLAMLRGLYDRLRDDTFERWQRDLPFEELLFDRWERARRLGFGEGTSIYHSSYVYGDVRIGRDTWIGPFTILDGSGGLTIGDNCSVASGVQIYSHDTVEWAVSGGALPYRRAPVAIGSCCYLGPGAVVAKGVAIGDHSVIGVGSYVNRNVPPYSIAVGVPCRVVGRVRVNGDAVALEYEPEAYAATGAGRASGAGAREIPSSES